METALTKFPSEVVETLMYYVYRLIDPRNGETFYVGKGTGNRVFSHIAEETKERDSDLLESKLERIREIKVAGFEVQHVIHRHGMDEPIALEVEAALIDAYPGLTNSVRGRGTVVRGVMHANEILEMHAAEPVVFQHRIMEILVPRTSASHELYEATRFAWRAAKEKAERADFVLAVVNGIVREVFEPEEWHYATHEAFPEHLGPGDTSWEQRIGFIGRVAEEEVRSCYIRKRMPDRKQGSANPIRYFEPITTIVDKS